MFQIKKTQTFGLDIGFNSLKVVQLKKKGKQFEIVGFAQSAIPKTSLQKNKILEKKKLAEVLKATLTKATPHHISALEVVAALPEHLVFTKIIELPKMKEKEVGKTIPYEASEFLPISLEETYLDWQILAKGANSEKIDVLVVAAPKSLVDDYIDLVKLAGLQLVALETKPIAASRALVKDEKEGLAILDIGAQATSVAIIDESILRLTGTTATGSNAINFALQRNLNLKEEEASKIKIEKGLSTKTDLKTRKIIETALLPIVDEVTHAIKYYQNRIKAEGRISKIKLGGGGAALAGIASFFEKQTGILTELGNPLIHLSKQSQILISKTAALSFTTAIGLALRENK